MKKYFNDLRLAAKLGLGFGLCLALASVIAVSALTSMSKMSDAIQKFGKVAMPHAEEAATIEIEVRSYQTLSFRLAGAKTTAASAAISTQMEERAAIIEKSLTHFIASSVDGEDGKLAAEAEEHWKKYRASVEGIKAELGKLDAGNGLKLVESKTTSSFNDGLKPALDKLREKSKRFEELLDKESSNTVAQARSTVLTATFAAFLCAIMAGMIITRMIVGALGQISEKLNSLRTNCIPQLDAGVRAIADGDLTVTAVPVTTPILLDSKDELGKIAKDFNEMLAMAQSAIGSYNEARASLATMIGKVSESAITVSSTSQTLAAASEESGAASSEIAAGSEKLAQGSTEAANTVRLLAEHVSQVRHGSELQGAIIQQMAASIEESNVAVQSVSNSAKDMHAAAQGGNEAVAETVAAMSRVNVEVGRSTEKVRELDRKGQEIGQIVGTIQQIAEQTNLLALNAAIEAARAAEHGRGFAVVADEVRKLAEQSSLSTKQIAELIASVKATVDETVAAIDSAQNEVAAGTAKSTQAGQALTTILEASQKVLEQNVSVAKLSSTIASQMREVAVAAEQNLTATDEMARNTNIVQESIESVAAVSEESAAGAEELSASIEEVGRSASELAHSSQELEALVATFKLEDRNTKARLKIAA